MSVDSARETQRWHESDAWTKVDVDDNRGAGMRGAALMPLAVFKKLSDYSRSLPSGQYIGKRWRCNMGGEWFMGEYVEDPYPEMIGIRWRDIYIRKLWSNDIATRATEKELAAHEAAERLRAST